MSESKKLLDLTNILYGSCVYFLSHNSEIVYVGQSRCVGSRIEKHKRQKKFNKVFAVSVDPAVINDIESAFIRVIRPKFNNEFSGEEPKIFDFKLIDALGMRAKPGSIFEKDLTLGVVNGC